MSQRLIDLNPDLKRLRDEGFTVEVRGAFLLVHNVPYVCAQCTVKWGTLVSTLHLAGETVLRPDNHVVQFIGEQPCHKTGQIIAQIVHQAGDVLLDTDLLINRSFSNKPADGYVDYYHKMSTYADIISGPAFSINPDYSPRLFTVIEASAEDSVFHYHDTSSSRAGISAINNRLAQERVAIFGIGGTGSYILDLVAKTPVRQIDLYDGDRFHSHNAFRAPGAVSLAELEAQPNKAQHFAAVYSKLRRGIVAHANHVTPDNEAELEAISFAFVAIDSGASKKWLLRALEDRSIPYIDCGIGVDEVDGILTGQVRTTCAVPGVTSHVWDKGAIGFQDDVNNDYSRNIQIADLNALNATLAVIKWKKLMGFYLDLEREMHSIYPIDGNTLINAYQRSGD